MPKLQPRKSYILPLSILGLLALLSLGAGGSEAAGPSRVIVENLLSPQPVKGTVRVEGTIRHARMVRVRETLVPPVGRGETNQLVSAGVVESDGFTRLTLSLQGEIRGDILRPGDIGVILLPDEAPILEAFEQYGRIQLPLEVFAPVAAGGVFFEATAPELPVAFPRYRVLLYNTTDKTAAVHAYAYLGS